MMAVYPPMLAIQTMKEILPMLKKVAFPPVNQSSIPKSLYTEKDAGHHPMSEYKLRLATKEMHWDAKHNPVVTFRYVFPSLFFIYLPHPAVPFGRTKKKTKCNTSTNTAADSL